MYVRDYTITYNKYIGNTPIGGNVLPKLSMKPCLKQAMPIWATPMKSCKKPPMKPTKHVQQPNAKPDQKSLFWSHYRTTIRQCMLSPTRWHMCWAMAWALGLSFSDLCDVNTFVVMIKHRLFGRSRARINLSSGLVIGVLLVSRQSTNFNPRKYLRGKIL